MKFCTSHFTVGLITAAALTLTACGGGGSNNATATAVTKITPIVMDGLISNAVVCWDANNNDLCDTNEIQGITDSTGQATLSIPTSNVAGAKLLAVITAGVSSDADTGLVTTSYTLRAPAGQHTVINPLTDMAQAKITTDSTQTFEKAQTAVLSELGLNNAVSIAENFIAKRSTDSNYQDASIVARTLVLVKQAASKSTKNCVVLGLGFSLKNMTISEQLKTGRTSLLQNINSALTGDDSVRTTCSSDPTITSACDAVLKEKADSIVASCATTTTPTTSSTTTISTNSTQLPTTTYPTRTVTPSGKICYTGPNGGTYTLTASGNKNYGGC